MYYVIDIIQAAIDKLRSEFVKKFKSIKHNKQYEIFTITASS